MRRSGGLIISVEWRLCAAAGSIMRCGGEIELRVHGGPAGDACLDQESGWRNGGQMGRSNPAEDVSTYKRGAPCQPTAPRCQLARPPLHIERPAEHRGPPEPAISESALFALHPANPLV